MTFFAWFESWEFPEVRGTLFWGVLIIRILLFRVLYEGPLFSQFDLEGSGFRCSGFGFCMRTHIPKGPKDPIIRYLGLG